MENVLGRLPEASRVAVIRLRSLGDCVLTTPALALLKAHRPDLQIGVVVEDRFRGVFEANPDVDEILAPDMGALGLWHPALALNLHGGTRSMWLTAASRASIRAGFAHHSNSFVYNARIPRAQEIFADERPVHTAEHLASAMFWLGVPQTEIPRARLFYSGDAPTGDYAVIHPFASAPEKQWPADRFLAIASHLSDTGLDPVFLAGPGDDTAPFDQFLVHRNAPLNQVKAIIAGARIFAGNDSGPAHIAAAFGVPVAVLFGPSNPVTWAPWRTDARVLTDPNGMSGIEATQVIQAIESLRALNLAKDARAPKMTESQP